MKKSTIFSTCGVSGVTDLSGVCSGLLCSVWSDQYGFVVGSFGSF